MIGLSMAASLMLGLSLVADPTGSLRLTVTFEETGEAIPWANISSDHQFIGGVTDSVGTLVLGDLEAGIYRIRVSAMEYRPKSFELDLAPGESAYKDIALQHPGLGRELAATVSVGVDVFARDRDFDLRIVPAFEQLEIGSRPSFLVSLTYFGEDSVVVGALDGPDDMLAKCPRRSLAIHGRSGQVRSVVIDVVPSAPQPPEFVVLHAGETCSARSRGCALSEPGRYMATYSYQATCTDVRDWLDFGAQEIDPAARRALGRVAMVTLADSVEFVVAE
ncbi:MAG: carboxypeptidase-like regulatory domain-containing protein [Candidatus Eisenbacteria bacterium]|uniref:Carboxypeptidase-like regulatory domain-containing protein n=1 Tax=Eiseniibacteriota bacterium TaxID=2212470 RepID=A0A956SEL3_UNCEI|nr:carboxypeptidase-like regulatory domain-containing protein [Candidatus Eisenbacteria bacterium]